MKGDKLKLCLAKNAETGRPTSFDDNPDTQVLIVLERWEEAAWRVILAEAQRPQVGNVRFFEIVPARLNENILRHPSTAVRLIAAVFLHKTMLISAASYLDNFHRGITQDHTFFGSIVDSGLNNKTVIVTGASGGIGQEVARSFAGEGANVAVHYFRNADRAEELLLQLPTENKIAIGADLRDQAQVSQMFEQVESALGPAEVLVANAGFWPPDDTPLSQMTLKQWNETIATDLTSVFLCVQEFLRRVEIHSLEAPSIVMIGSTAGHFGEAGHADYAASKSGLMYGLLASLKNEIPRIARLGRINAVCPGWTMTPMARKFSANTDSMVRAQQTIPLRKFGQPRDVASAILFLASSKLAGHITGQTLFVSGGMEGRVLYDPDEIDLAP